MSNGWKSPSLLRQISAEKICNFTVSKKELNKYTYEDDFDTYIGNIGKIGTNLEMHSQI